MDVNLRRMLQPRWTIMLLRPRRRLHLRSERSRIFPTQKKVHRSREDRRRARLVASHDDIDHFVWKEGGDVWVAQHDRRVVPVLDPPRENFSQRQTRKHEGARDISEERPIVHGAHRRRDRRKELDGFPSKYDIASSKVDFRVR